jgi:hypothetical protein
VGVVFPPIRFTSLFRISKILILLI